MLKTVNLKLNYLYAIFCINSGVNSMQEDQAEKYSSEDSPGEMQ